MQQMEYRKLGHSGLEISAIGLGSWLTYGTQTEEETAQACIARAYDHGVTFFDTANAYGRGRAEEVVGRTLAVYARDSYVLATKVYFPMGDRPTQRGLSRKHIIDQCDASLRRLQTDYIDLYQCHRYDPETPLEEVLRALEDLVRWGKIRYAGVSEWSAAQLEEAVRCQRQRGWDRLISNQPIYNMLVRYVEEAVLPVSRQMGIGQVVFSPLAQGILTGKYTATHALPPGSRATQEGANQWIKSYLVPEVLEAVGRLRAMAESNAWTLPALALAWVLRRQEVSTVIIGASRPEQIDQNLSALDISWSPELTGQVDEILRPLAGFTPVW